MKHVIILPTYNEKENIALIVERIFAAVPDAYVLVVDDNSPDGTAAMVEMLTKKFPKLSLLKRAGKEGLGKAYVAAFQHVLCDADVGKIVMMDADLSHNPLYLPRMFEEAKRADVVIGSRYVKGAGVEGWELWRRILSLGGNLYCRLITGMPISDCTGGFNVIDTSLLRKVDVSNLGMSGYAFIMELKYSLYTAGAKFFEVPIIFRNRVGGESKISSHIISEGIVAPWKMRFKHRSSFLEPHERKY